MDLFTIDKSKCIACGVCCAVCPAHIIELGPKAKTPALKESSEGLCINCGHCVAVCPKGALSLATMRASACKDLFGNNRFPEPQSLELFLRARRSIRNFKDKTVSRKTIEELIDVARYAPSGINRQPVNWLVVYDKAKIKQVAESVIEWMRLFVKEASPFAQSLNLQKRIDAWEAGSDEICRGAPHLVIAYAVKFDPTAPAACTIALTYMELAAASRGLGTCWAGYVHMAINSNPAIKKLLGMSPKTDCFGALLLGYPKYQYRRIPQRNKAHVMWK